ncbi:hypothetical protein NC00_13370 [Xanthomonas cannabis pv. phaseoli]|uniref:Nudix hydrolase domain-containing protein n=1 Tax=Xanthomonas cannabis pv. phaseoli TaxID=1885902 RepID=A0AB34P6P1_9XANT|nr:hypothetical protein NC00_13370 [Xanthomonas cannabis pv. phaseoli]
MLAAEAMAAVLIKNMEASNITSAPDPDWSATHMILDAAYRATCSATTKSRQPLYPNAIRELELARTAVRSLPVNGALVARPVAKSVKEMMLRIFDERSGRRDDASRLLNQVMDAADGAAPWLTAKLTAEAIAADLQAWAVRGIDSIVNQAGQWALPGGGTHDSETAEDAARREFGEETGQSLQDAERFRCDLSTELVDRLGNRFGLFRFHSGPDSLADVAERINLATRANRAVYRPNGPEVSDWEIERVQIVAPSQLRNHLGQHVELTRATILQGAFLHAKTRPPQNLSSIALAPEHYAWLQEVRQNIDWYGQMAAYLLFPDRSNSDGDYDDLSFRL